MKHINSLPAVDWTKHFWKVLFFLAGCVLLFLASYFAIERMISADTADYLVHLINNESFYYGSKRFIAIPTQVLSLILINLEAPFKLLVQSYSLSLMAFHVIVLWAIVFLCKRPRIAMILLLGHLLGGDLLFYYPVSEYQMGLSLSLLWYAMLPVKEVKNLKWWKYALLLFLLVTAIYAHPLAVLFIGFILAYNFLEFPDWRKWQVIVPVVVLVIFVFVSKYLFFSIHNDTQNVSVLSNLKFFPLHAFKILWGQWITYHYIFLTISLITLAYLIWKKKYWHSALLILSFYAFMYAFLSKQGPEPYHWYSAHIYQSLYYLPVFVLLNQVPETWWRSKLMMGTLSIVLLISLVQTVKRSSFNQERITVVMSYLEDAQNQGVQKAIVDHKHPDNKAIYWFWALEYESLILSKYYMDETRTVIYKFPEDYCATCPKETENFLTVWGAFPLSECNPSYFNFDDSPYQVIETTN